MDRKELKVLFEAAKKYADKLQNAMKKNPGSIIIIDEHVWYNPRIRISGQGIFLDDMNSSDVLSIFYNTLEDFEHSIIYKGLKNTEGSLSDIDIIHYFFKSRLKAYQVIPIF